MKKVFNLKAFRKTAFYEDVRGYWNRNSRCWQNCLKFKTDGKDTNKQKAYNECSKEYNEWPKDKWILTYSGSYSDSGNSKINQSPVETSKTKS